MSDIIHQSIENNLAKHMKGLCGLDSFQAVLNYGVLPAGKLFRPKLAVASFRDHSLVNHSENQFLKSDQDIALVASALEVHHAYTLIHDDLPCMDDDDYRRGRESTHKKYGQWQAVLAGDALLHHSHALIGKCRMQNHYPLRAIFNWALGAKGLILGQVFDLGGLANSSFQNLLRTHELKTGRLIQTSLLAGAWTANSTQTEKMNFALLKEQMRLGSHIGIVFQLLDDLSELTGDLSSHEREINPFLRFPKESFVTLEEGIDKIRKIQGKHVSNVLEEYFFKMKTLIKRDLEGAQSKISLHLCDQEIIKSVKILVETL